jgi:hypothetical protein
LLDYQSPRDFVKFFDVPAEESHIVTPNEGVQVSGENVIQAGVDPASGFAAYRLTLVESAIRVQISGQAPPRPTEVAGSEGGSLVNIPDPASQRRWILLAGFGLVMLAGFAYLYTR